MTGNSSSGTERKDEFHGEVEQTVSTLRGEAEELRDRGGNDDVAEQLEFRAVRLEDAYGRYTQPDTERPEVDEDVER